jgi:thiosulfate/3-mercaptopyruvate sulfurtransferase
VPSAPSTRVPTVPPIVDAAWVRAHEGSVVLADVRWYLDGRSGRAAYEAGHLPGAVFVDIEADLSSPGHPTDGRHPLPAPEHFADAMGRLGLAADDVVVAYDDSGGATAGRLVWMLRVPGRDAALLDGGLVAWDGPVDSGPGAPRRPVTVPAAPWPRDRVASADATAAAARFGHAVVVDARSAERYAGTVTVIDPRPGHIPGARNAPWAANLGEDGRFLPSDTLRAKYAALGVEPGTEVIAYCGSGVSACADLLALESIGVTRTRLHPASWSGWSADASRPAATGQEP